MGLQGVCLERSVCMVSKQMLRRARVAQVTTGGLSGLTAVVLMLGLAIACLTTSTKFSTEVVVAGITIAGALIGGFIAAPYLNDVALGVHGRHQDEDLS